MLPDYKQVEKMAFDMFRRKPRDIRAYDLVPSTDNFYLGKNGIVASGTTANVVAWDGEVNYFGLWQLSLQQATSAGVEYLKLYRGSSLICSHDGYVGASYNGIQIFPVPMMPGFFDQAVRKSSGSTEVQFTGYMLFY